MSSRPKSVPTKGGGKGKSGGNGRPKSAAKGGGGGNKQRPTSAAKPKAQGNNGNKHPASAGKPKAQGNNGNKRPASAGKPKAQGNNGNKRPASAGKPKTQGNNGNKRPPSSGKGTSAKGPKGGAVKKGNKPNKNTPKVEYNVYRLANYKDDGEKSFQLAQIQKVMKDAITVMTHGNVVNNLKNTVIIILDVRATEETSKYLGYANALADAKKEFKGTEVKYAILSHIPFANLKGYNYIKNNQPFYELVRLAHHVTVRDTPLYYTINTCMTYRALTKNVNCQTSVWDLLRPGGFFKFYEFNKGKKVRDLPDTFNAGFFYACLRVRREFDGRGVVHQKGVGPFLRKRGLARQKLPIVMVDGDMYSYSGKDKFTIHNDKFAVKYHNNKKMKEWTMKNLARTAAMYMTKEGIEQPMILDPFVSVKKEENVFEHITCGLYIKPIFELQELSKIKGKEPTQILMTMFLIAFFYRYCDLHDKETIEAIIKTSQTWKDRLALRGLAWDDTQTLDLQCCDNEHHTMRFGPYYKEKKLRRVSYSPKDGDGECCYRYMFGKYFPKIKIVEN